jgi:circadian clock protein KaiC
MEHRLMNPSRVLTGIEGLDNILAGGLPPGQLYLIQGDPGVGKTTAALQFLLDGSRKGEPGIYVTLSETKAELEAIAASHGWSLEGVTIFELAMAEETAKGDYTLFHPSEVELNQTTQGVLEVVERVRPKRLVFDSLLELRLLARDALRYRRQVLALKQFFVGRACTVLLLDDRTSGPSDLQLESIAHGVIDLEQHAPEYGSDRRRVRVKKLRGVDFRAGYHDFRIVTGGLRVFPRLVASEHRVHFQPQSLPSGVAELDQLLGGGIERGSSTLIVGPSGSGKSTLALQYVIAAATRDHRSAFFAFEEGLGTLLARTRGFGWDLPSLMERGVLRFQQVDPAELSPGEFSQIVRRSVEDHDVRIVVIDSLNAYMNSMPAERHLALHLHEMLSYLSQVGVASILVMAEHGLLGPEVAGPAQMSYLADSVIVLRYFESAGEVRQAISVLKKRSGLHEKTISQFELGPGGVRVGSVLRGFEGVLAGTAGPSRAGPPLPREQDDSRRG